MKRILLYSLSFFMLTCFSIAHAVELPRELHWVCQQYRGDDLRNGLVSTFKTTFGSSSSTAIKWHDPDSNYTYRMWVEVYTNTRAIVNCRVKDPNNQCRRIAVDMGTYQGDGGIRFAYPNRGIVYYGAGECP